MPGCFFFFVLSVVFFVLGVFGNVSPPVCYHTLFRLVEPPFVGGSTGEADGEWAPETPSSAEYIAPTPWIPPCKGGYLSQGFFYPAYFTRLHTSWFVALLMKLFVLVYVCFFCCGFMLAVALLVSCSCWCGFYYHEHENNRATTTKATEKNTYNQPFHQQSHKPKGWNFIYHVSLVEFVAFRGFVVFESCSSFPFTWTLDEKKGYPKMTQNYGV